MQKFTGTMTNSNPIGKVPKIWSKDHKTGEYSGRDSKTYHSKITLWVPHPRHGDHVPGIFIRLANQNGFAYARLTSEEFAELYTFFRTQYNAAAEALAKAEEEISHYRTLEKELSKNWKTSEVPTEDT